MIKATIISLSLLLIGYDLPLETPPSPPRQLAFYPEPFGLQLPEAPPPRKKVYRLQTKYFNQTVTDIMITGERGKIMKHMIPNSDGYWISARKYEDKKRVWIYTPDVIIIEEL